ncbi:MAG: response regulator transcription factor [Chitinophagaceae bacterium]|nr:response regulator transcription factor [Chitinophagaceae bacterium]
MIRILIADDHPLVRQRLVQILAEGFSGAYFEEAVDTPSLLNRAQEKDWDIIISDLAMPGGGGLAALEKIKESKPHIPVLIISIYPEEQYAQRVIQSGAAAFLNKDKADDLLVVAVKSIVSTARK